jgi:type IV secretion system protein VirB8
MDIFKQGQNWEAQRVTEIERSRAVAWRVAIGASVVAAVAVVAAATLSHLRQVIPYIVKVDANGQNIEVLQAFDNQLIPKTELMDMHWVERYVTSREQYNYWLVSSDYLFVEGTSDPQAFADYSGQYQGEKALDKVFGRETERRIKVLGVTASPTIKNQITVRFERTTMSKSVLAEPPTIYVATVAYRYDPTFRGSQFEMRRNPMGFRVSAYRRDAELASTATTAPGPAGTVGTANPAPQLATAAGAQGVQQ